MDRFHTNIYNTLYEHLKDGLTPPISSDKQMKDFEQNIKNLVLNSDLHVFDNGDTIWKKLSLNKHKFSYFDSIEFIMK
jgi:hypothetical protein